MNANQVFNEATERGSPDDGAAISSRKHSDAQQLVVFSCLNMLVVVLFALTHHWSQDADLQSQLAYQSYVCWIGLETFCLFLPGLVIGLAALRILGPAGKTLGFLTVSLSSAVYFSDFAVFVTLREHLFSSTFYRLVLSVIPFLHAYIGWTQLALSGLVVGGWLLAQFAFWKLAYRLSWKSDSAKQLSWRTAIGISLLAVSPIIIALISPFSHFSETWAEITAATDRHPITASGFFSANSSPTLQPASYAAVRGRATMLDHAGCVPEFVERYANVRFDSNLENTPGFIDAFDASSAAQRPDVLIVISECLRPEAITAKTAPNIHRLAAHGLRMNQHYTVGNASCFSFFGVMFGLDACWYEQAGELPIGLFEGFKQNGYKTGFFGYDDFETFGMEMFCTHDRFDECVFIPPTQSTKADEEACRLAAEFFDRKGRYAADPNQPRLAILYIYSPHDYFYAAEDAIHTTEEAAAIGDSARRDNAKFARYLNSIHFMDRIISPLLNQDRITFVMGDHGESFGEDLRSMHGSALSQVQCHVGCVGFGPGITSKKFESPTSHTDILPTLFDACGIQSSDPTVFSGVSLLKENPKDRLVACRSLLPSKYLVVKPDREINEMELGYQGFFNWPTFMLAPGAVVDIYGDEIAEHKVTAGKPPKAAREPNAHWDPWDAADLLKRWTAKELNPDFAFIAKDPTPAIHRAIQSPDTDVRLHVIELIGDLGERSQEFVGDLETCLSDPDPVVRDAAFDLLHLIHGMKLNRNQ